MSENSNIVWKPVDEIPGYTVSSAGEVRDENGEPVKHAFHSEKGYYIFNYSVGRKNKVFSVHRLVAKAHLPNPFGKRLVRHVNDDKTNNSVENLEWVDHIRSASAISYEDEMKIRERLLLGESGASLALDYNTSEMSISRIHKRMVRELKANPIKKLEFADDTNPRSITTIHDVVWIAFVQFCLDREKRFLASSEIVELAVQHFTFDECNRDEASKMLYTAFQRLIKLGVLKKFHVKSKQKLFYGYANWFDGIEPKNRYKKKFDNTILTRLARQKGAENFHIQEFVIKKLVKVGHLLNYNEIKMELSKKFGTKEVDLSDENLLAIFELLEKRLLLKKQVIEITQNVYYGLPEWWFIKNGLLKQIYAP